MKLTLTRHKYTSEVTLGKLQAGELEVYTLEEPWSPDPDGPGGQKREQGKRESCVPEGEYVLFPHNGSRFHNVWCLVNPELGVYRFPYDIPFGQKWGRSAVLIHNANTTEDVRGCIAVGMEPGQLGGMPAVLKSVDALNRLRAALGPGNHYLTIVKGTDD